MSTFGELSPIAGADFDQALLPASSTPFERALERACRMPPEIWEAAGRVGDIKTDLPDAAIPFLIWELGLEPVVPYLIDLRRALAEGRAWQRIRGTPRAIQTALSWRDMGAVVEEDPDGWWDRYQLGLDRVITAAADRAALAALARLSQPAHSDLIRVYHGYDLRPLKLNGAGRINGGALVNDWSGLWLDTPTGAVKFSLGLSRIGRSDHPLPDFSAQAMVRLEMGGRYQGIEGFAVNRDALNGARVLNESFAQVPGIELGVVAARDFARRGPYLTGPHRPAPWGEPEIGGLAHNRLAVCGQRDFAFDEWSARGAEASLYVNDGRINDAAMQSRQSAAPKMVARTHLELLATRDFSAGAAIDQPGFMLQRDRVNTGGLDAAPLSPSPRNVSVSSFSISQLDVGDPSAVDGWPQFGWPDAPWGRWGLQTAGWMALENAL